MPRIPIVSEKTLEEEWDFLVTFIAREIVELVVIKGGFDSDNLDGIAGAAKQLIESPSGNLSTLVMDKVNDYLGQNMGEI